MGAIFYSTALCGVKFIKFQCIREVVLHKERGNRDGGYILACTHLSHLEPVAVSAVVPRIVHWMARKEFYKYKLSAKLLDLCNAFKVNRQGIPVSSIRRAIDLAQRGQCVGIFPEGGVKKKHEAVFRGGPMKRGVSLIAYHAQVPVIPVVVLGTDKLNRVQPWLPARRGRLWINFGEPITPPPPSVHRRVARFQMADAIHAEFQRAYQELLEHSGQTDADVP